VRLSEDTTMTNAPAAQEFRAELQRLDSLLRGVERFPDVEAQAHTRALLRAVLELHGAGLARLLDYLAEAGEVGQATLDACVRDEVIGGLLLLHGLHPLDVEARVRQALTDVQPYLRSHGGDVELLGVEDGVVHLRLQGSCHSCPSSALTTKQTVEEAILARAPDVTSVEIDGLPEHVPGAANGSARVALPVL
jgi:Fe-S cluster biogenesis protein NfuA